MKALFALTTLAFLATVSVAVAAENLIGDPGFEKDPADSSWNCNDWWSGDRGQKNLVEFARDEDYAHSGQHSMRMALKTKRGGNLQLLYPLTGLLEGGDAVQIRFWVRGPSNSPGVSLMLDQNAHPWTEYYRVDVPTTEEWSEQVFNLTLPPRIDRRNLRLMFLMDEESVMWLDDVSVRRLPEKEGGEPLPGNRVPNHSFETGRNYWYASFTESGRTPVIPFAVEQNINAELRAAEAVDAPHGRRVLRCRIPRRSGMKLTSAFFRLRYGYPAEISFYARKTDGAGDLQAELTHGEFPNLVSRGEKFKIAGEEWQQCKFQVTPTASTGGKYCLLLTSYSPGVFEFDNFQVREIGAPPADPAPELGWRRIDDSHPGNIFHRGEGVRFDISAYAPGSDGNLPVSVRVVDIWEREVVRLPLAMPLDAGGYGQSSLKLPSSKYGAFKCEFRLEDAETDSMPLLELVYHVVPELTPLKEVEDSYFGAHFQMTPYNLSLAEKGGYRWLRLHPPMNTKWEVVEPGPGRFRFHKTGLERAHARGFKILGNLQATPNFYADTPRGKRNYWWDNWAPKEEHMDAYERYVKATVTAFDDFIRYWEIWNEPDICFLNVPEGRDKVKVYLELCRRTRQALDGADVQDKVLVGGAVTDNDLPFTIGILKQGVGEYVEAFSFHHYSSGLQALIRRRARIAEWRQFKNCRGQAMPIWQTESGIYTRAGATWLRTSGRKFEPGHEMSTAAARMLQNLVFFKAIGVEKFFTYSLSAHPAGRMICRNDWQSVIDINGIPYSPFPAHAVAVHFLEGANPVGMETFEIDEVLIFIARFERSGTPVTVAWSSEPVPLENVSGLKSENSGFYDMMGNPVREPARLSTDPLYIVPSR